MFLRKKTEKPKSPIGLVLYEYDENYNKKINNIIKIAISGGKLNSKRNSRIFKTIMADFQKMKASISKEKLKVDYRSDKARDMIIEMIESLEKIINDLDGESLIGDDKKISTIKGIHQEIKEKRDLIRTKLKDVESDYY
jgi:hypothetical protein